MRPILVAAAVACATAPFVFDAIGGESAPRPRDAGAANRANVADAALTRSRFVPNLGQWRDEVRFAVLGDTTGWLHDDGFTLRLERFAPEAERGAGRRVCEGAVVRTRFVGGAGARFDAEAQLAGRFHFLVGDAARHARDVPAYASATSRDVLPGIDVRYRPLPDGARGPFEYDLLLAPGADLSSFVAEVDGVDALRVDRRGRLVAAVPTPSGVTELVQQAPVAWQVDARGQRRPLEVAFRLLGTRRYGFAAVGADLALATVVDPGVVWGTYLGGGASDRVNDLEWDPGNGIWIGGWAGSADFPTTVGAYRSVGMADGFVAHLSDDGATLLSATYLGGSDSEEVRGVGIGPNGAPTAVGFTGSGDFPTTPGAVQAVNRGGSIFLAIGDAFVSTLAADGGSLVGSTLLGGIYDDVAEDVLVTPGGVAVVAGWTSSGDFPIPAGGFQETFGGLPIAQSDGFVVRVPTTATSIATGTFLGGVYGEQLLSVDRDPTTGDLLVAGWCFGAGFPTTPFVLGPSSGGGIDGVVARFASDLSTAVFSTYLGGNHEDAAQCARFAPDGTVWVGGFTDSVNFPATNNAPQQAFAGANDGFISHISADAQSLIFSTYLGGTGQDRVRGVDVSTAGVMVVGEAGDLFPLTPDALQLQFHGGGVDGFATYLTNGGATMTWSTYLGGVGQDSLRRVQFEDSGLAVLGGYSYSADFPIAPAALQPQLLGVEDGVLMQLDLLTDLGEGLQVQPAGGESVELVEAGEVSLLPFDLLNVSDRHLVVDGVRVFVSGAGATANNVTGLRVLRTSSTEGEGDELVGGPVAASPGAEVHIALDGAVLPPRSSTRFVVRADVAAPPFGRSYEVAAAVVDAAAWDVRALGAGGGPDVRVGGAGRATGPTVVLGAVAGDVDGSGTRTVVDLRRMLNALGSTDAEADADGDGVLTLADVDALRGALLGRGTVFGAPAQAARGGFLLLPCLMPVEGGLVQASLGGRSLTIGRASPRQLSLRVEPDQTPGLHELVITQGGQVAFTGLVEIF